MSNASDQPEQTSKNGAKNGQAKSSKKAGSKTAESKTAESKTKTDDGQGNGKPKGKDSGSGKRAHPTPKSREAKVPLADRQSNAVTKDDTYSALRADNRVVMRHNIALNLDAFNPATEEFVPRPEKEYPALKSVQTPFFSVIVPNYNGQSHLPGLFNALANQQFGDFEIILVDDASSDDSVSYAESFLVSHAASQPETRLDMRVLVNRRNLGFAASVNLAAEAARGRVLVLLNNDTEPESDWLKELALAICTNPDAAIVASKLLLFDQRDTLHTAGDLLGTNGLPSNRGVWEKDQGQYDNQTDVFGGCGGAMAIRRDVWEALGGFDEEFWMYLEDVDFAFRAQLSGWRTVFAPDARVYHKVSSSGGDDLSSYYVGRNSIWLVAKNMPTRLLAKYGAHIIGAQLKIAKDALANIQGTAAQGRLRGQIDGLLSLPALLQKRRVIQPRRWREDDELAAQLTKR